MSDDGAWVGTWRPHKARGPIAALFNSPGPKYALAPLTGHQQHDPSRDRAPMYSFGIRPHETRVECSPGPSAYRIPSNTTRKGKDGTPAFSIQGRPKDPVLSSSPGPGTYSPDSSQSWRFRSAPSYSLQGKTKEQSKVQTPGPADYRLPPLLGAKPVSMSAAPCFSIYSRRKNSKSNQDLGRSPGPAAYGAVDQYISHRRPPSFSMLGRNYPPQDRTQRPGPGAYFPERVTTTMAKAPSFTFGLRHSEYIAPLIDKMP